MMGEKFESSGIWEGIEFANERYNVCQISSSERRLPQAGMAVFRIPCLTIQNISLTLNDARVSGRWGPADRTTGRSHCSILLNNASTFAGTARRPRSSSLRMPESDY